MAEEILPYTHEWHFPSGIPAFLSEKSGILTMA